MTLNPRQKIQKPVVTDSQRIIDLEAKVANLTRRNAELTRENGNLAEDNKNLFSVSKTTSKKLIAATEHCHEVVQEYHATLAIQSLLIGEMDCLKAEIKKHESNKPQKASMHHKDANRTKIESLQKDVELLTKRLDEANKVISNTNEDYQKYQIIKSYEELNQQLQRAQIEFNNRGSLYHDLRLTRNKVAHPTTQ
jgi:hypothetical protein